MRRRYTSFPAGGTLYLSPDVTAFRARTTSPKGNEGLFIQGNYDGQLSARGETLTLMDGARQVAILNYSGNPTDAQRYLRVTEMMYNPGSKPGDTFPSDEYEFIELKNTGTINPVALTGVTLTSTISMLRRSVTFTGSSACRKKQAVAAASALGISASPMRSRISPG